jgi:arginine repressor
MKQMDSQKKILLEIQSKKKHRGGMLGQYRHLLIEMTKKYFTHKEMAETLNKGGIKISRQSVSDYLMKMPITREELNGKNESDGIDLNQWKNKRPAKKSRSKKPVFFDISKPFK